MLHQPSTARRKGQYGARHCEAFRRLVSVIRHYLIILMLNTRTPSTLLCVLHHLHHDEHRSVGERQRERSHTVTVLETGSFPWVLGRVVFTLYLMRHIIISCGRKMHQLNQENQTQTWILLTQTEGLSALTWGMRCLLPSMRVWTPPHSLTGITTQQPLHDPLEALP